MHQLKLKLVRFTYLLPKHPILFYSECAALVKQGKVYGVGTEDMDVSEIFFLVLLIVCLGFDIWC
jgi:hypothetical protein